MAVNKTEKVLELIDIINNQNSYSAKMHIIEFLGNTLRDRGRKLPKNDHEIIKKFIMNEVINIPNVVAGCNSYKQKSAVYDYFESLMQIVVYYYPNPNVIDRDTIERIKSTITASQGSRYIENAINLMFEGEVIEENDAEHICDMVSSVNDEYQRGLIYRGLIYYRNQFNKLTIDAKKIFAEYIEEEITEYLKKAEELDEDERTNLEYACDISGSLATPKTAELMNMAIDKCDNTIRYYAVSTILEMGKTVSEEIIKPLAHDLTLADMTYSLLLKHSVTRLFPSELAEPVYLAKSNLVHWLTYPTELGKVPDEIEYIGCAKVKKEMFYIFKFHSDSDCLAEENKNKWLIGWSGNEGGTFSNFDHFEDYEQKTLEKTVKHIVKKLIK